MKKIKVSIGALVSFRSHTIEGWHRYKASTKEKMQIFFIYVVGGVD